jgi:signal transduction histidine kinase
MTLLKECVSIISLAYDRTLFCNCITNHNNNEEDEVIVSIKDTGIEIHPPILPKLFTNLLVHHQKALV